MQTIYIDIANKSVIPSIYAKQGDVGRKFLAIITDSGKPYIPPEGSVFSAWYEGSSGNGNYTEIRDKSAFSIDGNKITVELINQMLKNAGEGTFCLALNSANGDQISFWNIKYFVEAIPGFNSEGANEYYTAFSKAVESLPYPDSSLTQSGKAADAKATGDALSKKQPIGNYLEGTDSTLSVNGKAADAEATGSALAGKAPIGMVNGVATIDSIEELAYLVEDNVLEMDDDTVRSFSIRANFSYNDAGMGAGGLLTIHRGKTDDGYISFTATYADNTSGYRLRLHGTHEDDEWFHGNWEWENPPLANGVEYRTTERWNGAPVYVMQVSLGAMPNKTAKEYSLPISSQIIPVSYEGYAYNDEAEWPFPVYAAGAIAAYMGYKNDAIYVNATTNLSNYNLRVVVKYTK